MALEYILPLATNNNLEGTYHLIAGLVESGHWTIVEAYDASAASKLRVPTVGQTGSLTNTAFNSGGFSWAGLTAIALNDWIVLQSTNSGSQCQVLFRVASTTSVLTWMIPDANFATGGSDVSPPVLPATAFGSSQGTSATGGAALTYQASGHSFYGVVDAGYFHLFASHATQSSQRSLFAGQMVSSVPGDTKPFGLNITAAVPSGSATNQFARVSPGGTFIATGSVVTYTAASVNILASGQGKLDSPSTMYWCLPTMVSWNTANHRHVTYIPECYQVDAGLGQTGTLDDRNIAYLTSAGSTPAYATAWDGTTAL